MKALRYLLIASFVIMSVMIADAQAYMNCPIMDMQSTSVVPLSGSSLPQAAVSGVVMSETVLDNGGSFGASGPRRGKMEDPDPFGGQTIDDTGNPQEPGTPVGDGVWVLLLLAAGFAAYKTRMRRKETA